MISLKFFSFLIVLLIFSLQTAILAEDNFDDLENDFEDFDDELSQNSTRNGRFYWLFDGIKKGSQINGCSVTSTGQKGYCDSPLSCKIKNGVNLGDGGCKNGICCQIKAKCSKSSSNDDCIIKQTGASITQDTGTGNIRMYKIPKLKGACQIKLDFDLFQLEEETGGNCLNESLTISGSSTINGIQICGNNTGQHMYLEFGSASYISLTMRLNGNGLSRYAIRPTFIKCSSDKRVPSYCLQHYTAPQDRVRSFNNNMGQLNNQGYKVCVEPQEGINSIGWVPCPGELSPFSITGRSGDTTPPPACTTDWVAFFGDDTRYCGQALNVTPVVVNTKPFIMNVNFDGAEISSPNHGFWNAPNQCVWWWDVANDQDALRMTAGTGIVCPTQTMCATNSVCTIDFNTLIMNLEMAMPVNPVLVDLVRMLQLLDTGNSGFCLDYSQRV